MARARIAWARPGGRTAPPMGSRYACTATVGDSDHWSLVVAQDNPGAWDTDATVWWLVDAVPIRLDRGTEVDLWEGRRRVARAVIIG